MKIYTRNGDKGETGVLGAIKVSKSHLVIEVCGTVDETNCHLGCAIAHCVDQSESGALAEHAELTTILTRIQNDLFDLGSRVAAAMAADPKTKPANLDESNIRQMEAWIDRFDGLLPPLQAFILPGGSHVGCQLHLARTVCRRAERRLVSLLETDVERDLSTDLIYLNRLSDLLFVLARFANQQTDCPETPWVQNK